MPLADPRLEPALPDPTGSALTRRALAWGALGVVTAGAAVARLTGAAAPVAGAPPRRFIVQLTALRPEDAARALAASSFSPAEQTAMLAAVRERRLHLVEAPFFGTDGALGHAITVAFGPVKRTIVLAARPVPVLLPIERAGRILLTADTPMPAPASIGLVTAETAIPLPAIGPGDTILLDVIVQ